MADKNFGEIFLVEDGTDGAGKPKTKLEITINGVKYSGVKNERKSAESHPDYRIFKDDADVGAAWKGQTSKGNQKLSMKITGFEKNLTAVMSKDPKDNDPDMVIMPIN